ncbi:hypothetical protein [Natrinema amylolyticum]|uniref:hypothetical protein n=1 Tax=Natrinema amylolyticum TaxID=2878679 RepID=UPI001CFB9353|nr:hypothetical protein [Natrinema amylolyticum]
MDGDASISVDAQSTTPDTILAVDGQSSIDDRPESFDNTLTVTKKEKTFEWAPYTVTTTGTIVPTTDTEAVSDGTTALDAVGITPDTDTYRYTGELETILTLGPAIFKRNGKPIPRTEITGPPFRRVFPEMYNPTVTPGTTVHFELDDSMYDQTRSLRSEWWVDGTLITDSFFDPDPVERSMFPANRDYFHHTFEEPGTYTVEGALLPAQKNTRDTPDIPVENRVTWNVTVRDDGNRAPQVGPHSPVAPMTIGDDLFSLEANVLDWDGELARVYWRYRFGDVYLGDSKITGVHDVALLHDIDLELYYGAFEVLAVNTTGAVTSAILWEVESSSGDPTYHTIRPVCDHTVRGIHASDTC